MTSSKTDIVEIQGSLERIVFQNSEASFAVMRLKVKGHSNFVTVAGPLPLASLGSNLKCLGSWKTHPTYGMQLEVTECELQAPSDEEGIQKYLGSGIIEGIGPKLAEKIVEVFKEKTLEILDHEIGKLLRVPGIGEKKLLKIQKSAEKHKLQRAMTIKLQTLGISPSYAKRILKALGSKAIDLIEENPYCLAKLIPGIGFKIADQFAQKVGVDKQSVDRCLAGFDYFLHEKSSEGHTCYPLDTFQQEVCNFLDLPFEVVCKVLEHETIEQDFVIEQGHIWLKKLYFAEKGVAKELKRLSEYPGLFKLERFESTIEEVESSLKIEFAPKQKQAIFDALSHKVHIITGGPGTGKSTIIKAILTLALKTSSKIVLCAPTGRASKRMHEVTGKEAFTIHSLLQYDFKKKSFKRNRANPLECDLIIIDESSMIDTFLMYQLLQAIADHTHLLLVGDIHQLPSIGPGNLLKDMLESSQISMTYLDEIFRQAKGSLIITNAHAVKQGEFPNLKFDKESDFFYIKEKEPSIIVKKIIDLIRWRLPKAYGLHRTKQIQVLSPMRRGVIGIDALNQTLQEALNTSKESVLIGSRTFYLGDKVMQIRNNYQKEVFNGDIGFIKIIDQEEQVIKVCFEDKWVSYEYSELDDLVLAYATSVHKYQGSECPCVIIPLHTSHYMMLKRNLLYTAITRGKKLVILIGMAQAIGIAVNQESLEERTTFLKKFLL